MTWSRWVVLGLSVACAAAIGGWAVSDREVGVFMYGRLSYWVILALVLLWVWHLWRHLAEQSFVFVPFVRRNVIPLGAALAITVLDVVSVKPQFRVLSDETNLLGVSQSMLLHKTVFNSTQQKRYYGSMNPVSFEVEKRPLVFPFLVQVLHTVRGYSPQNAFVLNAAALFALLAIVGIFAHAVAGNYGAVAGVILAGTYPLVAMTARSAGFDLLAVVFTLLCFVLAYLHMRAPSARRLAVLVTTLLMFAHVRYESSVYVAILALGLLAFRYVRLPFIRAHLGLYAAAPLLLLPLVIQRILTPRPYENEPGVAAFSTEHLGKFLGRFLAAQTDFEFLLPHEPTLYWLAVPAVIFLGLRFFKRRATPDSAAKTHLFLLFSAAFVASHAIFFSYYFGDFTHPASARFFLLLSLVVAFLPVAVHRYWPKLLTRGRLLGLAVALALIYHPVSVQGRFTTTQTLWRESEFEWSFLARHATPNTLTIAGRPGQLTALNYGAVDFDYANRNAATLLLELKRHLYSEIYVSQRIVYATMEPAPTDRLGAEFKLETVEELQTSAEEFRCISRVVPAP